MGHSHCSHQSKAGLEERCEGVGYSQGDEEERLRADSHNLGSKPRSILS